MEKFLAKLQLQAQENPLVAIGVGVAVLSTVSKFIEVLGNVYGRRTWSQEVARRAKKRFK